MIVEERLRAMILRNGESLTIDGVSVVALVTLSTPSQSTAFIPSDGAYLVSRPLFHLLVSASTAAEENDGVVFGGDTYEVHHVHALRWRGTIVAKLVVIS